jgi:hypothetical protein
MGRILFLSAVALLAYKYIARSNQKHQSLDAPDQALDLLPPTTTAVRPSASESRPEPKLVVAGSRAVEPDPGR